MSTLSLYLFLIYTIFEVPKSGNDWVSVMLFNFDTWAWQVRCRGKRDGYYSCSLLRSIMTWGNALLPSVPLVLFLWKEGSGLEDFWDCFWFKNYIWIILYHSLSWCFLIPTNVRVILLYAKKLGILMINNFIKFVWHLLVQYSLLRSLVISVLNR